MARRRARTVSGSRMTFTFDGVRHTGRIGKAAICDITPALVAGLGTSGFVLACGGQTLGRDYASADEAKAAVQRERFKLVKE